MKATPRLLGILVLSIALLVPIGALAQSVQPQDGASSSLPEGITPTPTPVGGGVHGPASGDQPPGSDAPADPKLLRALREVLGAESSVESVTVKGQRAEVVVSSPELAESVTITAHEMPDGSWKVQSLSELPILAQASESVAAQYGAYVSLYDLTGYVGAAAFLPGAGQYSLQNSFNDRAESIAIPAGYAVRLYKDMEYSGPRTCLTVSDHYLWDNTYGDGTTVANSVTGVEVYAQPSCPPARPDKPSDLRVTEATESALTLAWADNSDNENGFQIYRWGWDGMQWTFLRHAIIGANQTSFTDTGLTSGTQYYYALTAYNDSGESILTDWVVGTTLIPGSHAVYLPLTQAGYAPPITMRSLKEDGEVGRIYCQNWWSCRSATSGNLAWAELPYGSVTADYSPDGYAIKRVFLRFDTSSIPAGAEITHAALYVYSGASQAGGTGVYVVNGDQGAGLSIDDFDDAGLQYGGGAHLPPGTWVGMEFNDLGRSWIAPDGYTELALVHQLDLLDTVPTQENRVSLALHESGELAPYLLIRYRK